MAMPFRIRKFREWERKVIKHLVFKTFLRYKSLFLRAPCLIIGDGNLLVPSLLSQTMLFPYRKFPAEKFQSAGAENIAVDGHSEACPPVISRKVKLLPWP